MTICDFVGRSFAAIVVFAALGLPTPSHSQSTAGDEFLSYTGRAEAPQGHGFLYGEKHILVLRGGKLAERVVLYTCRDGSAFARKKSFYDNGWSPDFVLDDASNGMQEGVRSEGGGRQVFFRAARSDRERSKSLDDTAGLVVDTGFDAFVRDNWDKLMAKDGLTMRFLIPSHLSAMEFRVQHVRADRVEGVPVEVFRLTLSNIFGWFVPGIDVYYSAQDHVLMRYVGLSDLMDASGSNIRADITFALTARRAADGHDLATALQTRLMPCR